MYILLLKIFLEVKYLFVLLQGARLNQGARAEDYKILVGNGECVIVRLSFNEIECKPPLTPDPPDADKVKVFVSINPKYYGDP